MFKYTTINKICSKTTQQYKNQGWIFLEQRISTMSQSNFLNWLSGFKTKIKASTHNTGEDCDKYSLFKSKFLYRSTFFFLCHIITFQRTCISYNCNTGNTDSYAVTVSIPEVELKRSYPRQPTAGSRSQMQTKPSAILCPRPHPDIVYLIRKSGLQLPIMHQKRLPTI